MGDRRRRREQRAVALRLREQVDVGDGSPGEGPVRLREQGPEGDRRPGPAPLHLPEQARRRGVPLAQSPQPDRAVRGRPGRPLRRRLRRSSSRWPLARRSPSTRRTAPTSPANAVDRSLEVWVSNGNRRTRGSASPSGPRSGSSPSRSRAPARLGRPAVPVLRRARRSTAASRCRAGPTWGPSTRCGTTRTALRRCPTPRDTTYVEIRGPVGTARRFVGLYEVWIYEGRCRRPAEDSRAWLNLVTCVTEQDIGIVAWQNRSPNFYPANSGVARSRRRRRSRSRPR